MDHPTLILYSGAFDPPHQGHLDCIVSCLEAFPAARLLMSPTPEPTAAHGKVKVAAATFQQRLQLCSAIRSLSPRAAQDRFDVSPIEQNLPQPHYTINTLLRMRQLYPGQRIGFLMGQDQLEKFRFWHNPRGIVTQCQLITIARSQPDSATTQLLCTAEGEMQALGLNTIRSRDPGTIELFDQGHRVSTFFALRVLTSTASSSAMRKIYAGKKSLPSGWLHSELEPEQRIIYTQA